VTGLPDAHRPAGARPTPNWMVRAWAVRASPDKNVRIPGVPALSAAMSVTIT